MKRYKIYHNDKYICLIYATEITIEKDSYLYGGEEKYIYDLYMYCYDERIFISTNKNEIYFIGDSIFIYE